MKDKDRIFYYGPQQDERWHKLRLGLFTSSDCYILFKEPKTKKQKEEHFFSKEGINFIMEKAGDLLHGEPVVFPGNDATDWGNENEPIARKEFKSKYLLFQDSGEEKLSFVEILNEGTGTSPDDTIGKEIPVEYKCPKNRNNHLKALKIKNAEDLKQFSKKFYYQIYHQMFVLGSDVGFWCSFDPRLKNTKANHKSIHKIELKMTNEIYDEFCERIPKAVELRDYFLQKWIADE